MLFHVLQFGALTIFEQADDGTYPTLPGYRIAFALFLLCNAIGAATWASAMVSLSYFLGRLVPLTHLMKWVAQFTGIALAVVATWVLVTWWIESRRAPMA